MSSNVGLSTPRGSGTSGYVQRNHAFMKPRNAGAPYPPPLSSDAAGLGVGGGFRQRQPDKKILEHDRLREVEVKIMEERERLEEVNEELEEQGQGVQAPKKGSDEKKKEDKEGEDDVEEEGETSEKPDSADDDEKRILSDDEIDARCEALRAKLLHGLDEEQSGAVSGAGPGPDRRKPRRDRDQPPKERKQFKSYQVHELAEAKIEESERLRRALGIREDSETGEISSSNGSRFGGRR